MEILPVGDRVKFALLFYCFSLHVKRVLQMCQICNHVTSVTYILNQYNSGITIRSWSNAKCSSSTSRTWRTGIGLAFSLVYQPDFIGQSELTRPIKGKNDPSTWSKNIDFDSTEKSTRSICWNWKRKTSRIRKDCFTIFLFESGIPGHLEPVWFKPWNAPCVNEMWNG